MTPYLYSPLPEGSIRLLRIIPHPDKNSPVGCELFDFALSDSESTYPYDALSYVWGSAEKPFSIVVNDLDFLVGTNLYAALVHLRHGSLERIIWIDAICINQGDILEKGQQVQSMAEIYAKASCVVVWLGSASTTSDQALDNIREAALQNSTEGKDQKRIFQLLQRPWFQRIWPLVRSVTYLIRGAIFRPRHVTTQSSRFSLDIRPLSELVEMYHTRKATERHDKVYALLGMSSDDPSEAGLYVDYTIPWSQVFHRLVKELAVIDGKGLVLGEVSSVQRDPAWEDSQEVTIAWKNAYVEAGRMSSWAVQASAKNIQAGDIVCLLQGASRPTIIRLCHPYWAVVMISVPPTDATTRDGRGVEWSEILQSVTRFSRSFVLVWDWEMHPNESLGDQERKYEELMVQEMHKGSMTDKLYIIAILANIGFALQDLERHAEAEKYVRRSLRNFENTLKNVDNFNPASKSRNGTRTGAYIATITEALLGVEGGWLPLRWASEDGYYLTIELMLENVNPNMKNEAGRTPLSWASGHGYEALVNLLLGIEIVDPDARDEKGWTPLLWAASKGHETIVKLLLDTKKVDPNAKEMSDETRRTRRTPLLLAAEGGHEAVVRMLLDTNVVDLSASAETGEASLLWAVKNGHARVVQLLLQTRKIDPDAAEESEIEDESGRTPLMWAANNQHHDVVKLLLDTGKVDLETRDKCRRTAISLAAENGNDEIVKLLLSTDKADPDAADKDGRTPLRLAAEGGFEKVVQLLLDTNKVNTSLKDNRGRTPLSSAARNGHEAIVSMLAERNELSFQDLQRQILAPPKHEDFLNIRDEDYFDHRCQQLFLKLQQWIVRFSKFSDMRAARLTSEIGDEKIVDRLDNVILDGSDVDMYLCDRVRRRDVFTSVAMTMLWEFVFTRYLFGLDLETRQKLKSLETQLVGPPSAIRRWRATTLTLLSNRDSVQNQRDHDARAVSETIFQTLCAILQPPSNLESQLVSGLSRVTKEAVEVSVEMRSQKAEYLMLPPLLPDYDVNGDLASSVSFNAAMMNERGDSLGLTNEEHEAQDSKVRIVLFPLVVKKGGDYGDGDDEIVVYPAQVLVAPTRLEKKNMKDTLRTTEKYIRANLDGMNVVAEMCKLKAKQIEGIFNAVAPRGAILMPERYKTLLSRYWMAVRLLGKAYRLEALALELMEYVCLLAPDQVATQDQVLQLYEAIADLSHIPHSLPKDLMNFGPGTQYMDNHIGYISYGNTFSGSATNSGGTVTWVKDVQQAAEILPPMFEKTAKAAERFWKELAKTVLEAMGYPQPEGQWRSKMAKTITSLSRTPERRPWVNLRACRGEYLHRHIANIHERNHQVGLMRQIYTSAAKVYVWLGKKDENCNIAMRFVAAQASKPLRPRGSGYYPLWSRQEGKALHTLFDRRYWRRMWIIQELLHASDIIVWYDSLSFT
ncbi:HETEROKARYON incompatibility [Fusarium phyllophilum]|uniref:HETEROKARYON incompatibility n=1 Tax=Fusarium phyllophilum TaxID=47803 RepID=A0A8H5IKN6_9HYPO|nr:HETEROKARYON incompatibility [Fusarium phyllophilum]